MTLPHPLLARRPHRDRPALPLFDGLALALGRAHEFCGRARRMLAMLAAAASEGPVLWIAPAWSADRLNPEGMQPLVDPGRFIFVQARRPEDILWTLEEALRSGAVALAVADLPAPPGLTPVRRLHLAAETAAAETGTMPLGLLLTPESGGAPGVETRWRAEPAHRPGAEQWHLDLLRARTDPPRRLCLARTSGGAIVPHPGPA